MFQWRRFQFFDKSLVKEEGSNEAHKAIQDLDITCSTSGRGRLVFGDSLGNIHFVDRNFALSTFQGYEGPVSHVAQLKQHFLVTLGMENMATVKIWRVPDKADISAQGPIALRTLKVFSSKLPPVDITCFAVQEDLSHLAIGLATGSVVLYKGDLVRDRVCKQRVLVVDVGNPITGLGFRENKKGGLFVTSAHVTASFITDASGDVRMEKLDEDGCSPKCSVVSSDHELVVGRKEAAYFYGIDERGPCFAFEGTKKLLFWFRFYLLVVCSDGNSDVLSVYDLKNKFVAFSGTFQPISRVMYEWGSVFLLSEDKRLFQLTEKDTQTKLEMLFKKNFYSIAINLAKSSQYDYNAIIDIVRKYGDHLYGKGDFDGAITQYIATIGRLEPSYVIRKFLDAQRIHNLTCYLEALHEKKHANCDHTTLLLNCYTKTKEISKLAKFIQNDTNNFEVETAIRVCRSAGYYDHALYLAKKHDYHDFYLKILLDDNRNFQDALKYIPTLDFFEAEKVLKKHGKTLVENIPEDTTNLLMKLCTKYEQQATSNGTPSQQTSAVGGGPQTVSAKGNAEEFIHVFVNQPRWLVVFLEYIVEQSVQEHAPVSSLIYNTLLELYLRLPDSDIPTMAAGTTLKSRQQSRHEKAMALLQNPGAKFDTDQALVLVQIHNFQPGILFLFDKMGLYQEIVQFYMDGGDKKGVIDACKRYGSIEPNLWVKALSYFSSGSVQNSHQEIAEVLANIENENLLPPLLVVQILAANPKMPLTAVKDYIVRRLSQENQLITEDERLIRMYSEETDKMRAEYDELRTSAKVFQSSKCSACTGPLDLPAVHFLCMHSFHQRCLGDSEKECPVCAPNNKKTLEIKHSLEQSAGQHHQFFKQLEGSRDGFATVSEYFGRGIFRQSALPDEYPGISMDK